MRIVGPAGWRLRGRLQRLEMYSEISKPKRWSMAAGVVQVIKVSLGV
jgi:hypothetical protein